MIENTDKERFQIFDWLWSPKIRLAHSATGSDQIKNPSQTWSGLKVGFVVALGSIIGGGLLAVGLLALPSSPENKLNEAS